MGLVDLVKSDISYKKYFDSTSYLRGYEGKCFIEGDKILKFYFFSKEKKDFVDLSIYHSPYISFPINYFEFFDKIVGEEMPYFRKDCIKNSIGEETNYNLLKKNYLNIMKELVKFKEIYMQDLCYVNVLYDETGFNIIDTTQWDLRINKNRSFESNESLFNESLLKIISSVIDLNEYDIEWSFKNAMLKRGQVGIDLLNLIKNGRRDTAYLNEMFELYAFLCNKEYGKEIKTLEDAKKYAKMLKND